MLAIKNPFYITVFIVIGLCFLYILIFATIIPLIKNSKAKKALLTYLKDNNYEYQLIKHSTDGSDYKLIVNKEEYLLKIIDVKKNCDIHLSKDKDLLMYYKTITKETKSRVIEDAKKFLESKENNKIILFNSTINEITFSKNELEVIKFTYDQKMCNCRLISLNVITKK